MPRLAVGHPLCGRVGEQSVPSSWLGSSRGSRLAMEPGMRQAPFCQGLNWGVMELFSGVMEAELCLQMELLTRPSGSGRELG